MCLLLSTFKNFSNSHFKRNFEDKQTRYVQSYSYENEDVMARVWESYDPFSKQ